MRVSSLLMLVLFCFFLIFLTSIEMKAGAILCQNVAVCVCIEIKKGNMKKLCFFFSGCLFFLLLGLYVYLFLHFNRIV